MTSLLRQNQAYKMPPMRVPDRLTLRDVSLINHVRTGNQNSLGAHGFPEVQVIGTHLFFMKPMVFPLIARMVGFQTQATQSGWLLRRISNSVPTCTGLLGLLGLLEGPGTGGHLSFGNKKKVTSKGKLVCPEVFGGGNRGRKVGFSSCHLQWNHAGVWRP